MSIFLGVRIGRECSGRDPGFRKLGLCQECVDNVPAVRPRQVSLREVNSRIVGTATIVNTSNAAVRSTTGSLSLGRRAGGNATGVLTFSAGSLPPHGSSTMRLRTARVGTLLAGSRPNSPLICTDIYSQIQRFAPDTHCTRGAKLTITAISHTQSGPAPDTILKTPVAKLSRSSTMVLQFRLDDPSQHLSMPPRRWSVAHVPKPSGLLRARRWGTCVPGTRTQSHRRSGSGAGSCIVGTVDRALPAVTVKNPASGSTTRTGKPTFSGLAAHSHRGFAHDHCPCVRGFERLGSACTDAHRDCPRRPLVRSGGPGVAERRLHRAGRAVGQRRQPRRERGNNLRGQRPAVCGRAGRSDHIERTRVVDDIVVDGYDVDGTYVDHHDVDHPTTSTTHTTSTTPTTSPTNPPSGTDDFNRADGGLGANWQAMGDGGLSIASETAVGTAGAGAGDIRVGESYGSDQFSQVEVTSSQLSGGEWVGAAVRAQKGGQDLYLGIYFWNNGDPRLRLYKRSGGAWTQLGSSYESGPLPAGTQLAVSAVGSQISFSQDGTERIAVSDSSLTGGAPRDDLWRGAAPDNWRGGTPPSYSVGGSVSGLSGTLVLQDNGGDDPSVSGNGAFAFGTSLGAGAAYSVTVKSNPDGQMCSVSGATGVVASADVTSVVVTCSAIVMPPPGTDDFNRPNGGLGANWQAMGDGGLSIASETAVGTAGAGAGDIRVGESYGSDQFSQVEVTSSQLSGGEWVGAAVRAQKGGQDLYLGIYFWNNGDPAVAALQAVGRRVEAVGL